jgi:hypothetical protein
MLKDAFEAINLPLYLVPYSVIPNRTGPDHAQGGILQVLNPLLISTPFEIDFVA